MIRLDGRHPSQFAYPSNSFFFQIDRLRGDADRGGSGGELDPRAAGHACRPDGRPASGVRSAIANAILIADDQPDVLEAMHSVRFPKVVRRSIHLTPFGISFCQACLVDPEETPTLPVPQNPEE